MNEKQLEEQRLQKELSALRLRVKERKRVLFLFICGALIGGFMIAVCIGTRSHEMSPMEMYGLFPLVLFLLFGAAMIVAGWIVEAVENRAHEVEGEIQSLYEVDG